ncbi:hypothetical protein V8G54_027802 [Vigna mungo]|uniref:Uncharacterized protein n=1 Tax=Vigna mungo TaxID=3915 RepID=A0AAQ3RIS4_VIGMU
MRERGKGRGASRRDAQGEWQAQQRKKTKELQRRRRQEEEEEERKMGEYREIGLRLKEYPEEDVIKARKLVASFLKVPEEVEERIEEAAEKGELTELVLMVIWNRLDLARRDNLHYPEIVWNANDEGLDEEDSPCDNGQVNYYEKNLNYSEMLEPWLSNLQSTSLGIVHKLTLLQTCFWVDLEWTQLTRNRMESLRSSHQRSKSPNRRSNNPNRRMKPRLKLQLHHCPTLFHHCFTIFVVVLRQRSMLHHCLYAIPLLPNHLRLLRRVGSSIHLSTSPSLVQMLDDVEEFIEEENVVQVVNDNATNCKVHQITIKKGRRITTYTYDRAMLISMLKKFTKSRDLIWPGMTRFATSYLTLACLHELKASLMNFFSSNDWKSTKFGTSIEGRKIEHVNVTTCLKVVLPLIVVLRLVDSDIELAMGFIYEEMDFEKEKIKFNLNNIKKSWNDQLHRPLYVAAYYLNPYMHYEPNFRNDDVEVKEGLYACMKRLVKDVAERKKVNLQLIVFPYAKGLFSMENAKDYRKAMLSGEWWEMF